MNTERERAKKKMQKPKVSTRNVTTETGNDFVSEKGCQCNIENSHMKSLADEIQYWQNMALQKDETNNQDNCNS